MKKSIKSLLLATFTAATLVGCSGNQTAETTKTAETAAETTAETTAAGAADTTAAESSGEAKAENGASYTIGIGQFAAHGSLDNCREGFLQGLAEEGIVEGQNLTVLYENAQADGGIASQIVTNFVSQKVDLICGIATARLRAHMVLVRRMIFPDGLYCSDGPDRRRTGKRRWNSSW